MWSDLRALTTAMAVVSAGAVFAHAGKAKRPFVRLDYRVTRAKIPSTGVWVRVSNDSYTDGNVQPNSPKHSTDKASP